jgi:hypothetical protein
LELTPIKFTPIYSPHPIFCILNKNTHTMLHSLAVCLPYKAGTISPLSNYLTVRNKGHSIRIQQLKKKLIVFCLMALELTRRKIVSGSAKLLQREFQIRSINRKALHLCSTDRLLDVKASSDASKAKQGSSYTHFF